MQYRKAIPGHGWRLAGWLFAVSVALGAGGGQGAEPKQLAPGVIRVIPAQVDESDSVTEPFAIRGLVQATEAWTPVTVPSSQTLHELAQRAIIHRPVWQLEFGFKPLRMIRTSWREPDGTPREGLVWYLVYYVRNAGQHLLPVPHTEAWKTEYQPQPTDHAVRFLPTFMLEAHDQKKAYLDRARPQVVRAIQQREDPAVHLFDSVQISRVALEPASSPEEGKVWGVATWMDVDPQIDFFSVYVQGLTNAYRWQEMEGEVPPQTPPDMTRNIQQKTLQLNYYRPGDSVHQHEDEIFFGAPSDEDPAERQRMLDLYRIESPLEYLWIYR